MEIVRKSKDGRFAYVENNKGTIEKKYIYYCCICKKEIVEYRPVRLVKQLYGYGEHKQYYSIRNYDFCKECYWALDDLLFRWQKIKENKVLVKRKGGTNGAI